MIKLQIIGHLGKDASANTVSSKQVINFAVAHTEKWKTQSGEQQTKTTWVDCAWWTDKTGILPYLKKGTQVYAEGTPDVRTYPNKDGVTVATLSLKVGMVQLLGSAGEQPVSHFQENTGIVSDGKTHVAVPTPVSEVADDLPF